jgi:hypothetical protein
MEEKYNNVTVSRSGSLITVTGFEWDASLYHELQFLGGRLANGATEFRFVDVDEKALDECLRFYFRVGKTFTTYQRKVTNSIKEDFENPDLSFKKGMDGVIYMSDPHQLSGSINQIKKDLRSVRLWNKPQEEGGKPKGPRIMVGVMRTVNFKRLALVI